MRFTKAKGRLLPWAHNHPKSLAGPCPRSPQPVLFPSSLHCQGLSGTFWDMGALLWVWREVQVPPLEGEPELIRFVSFGGQEC